MRVVQIKLFETVRSLILNSMFACSFFAICWRQVYPQCTYGISCINMGISEN